MSGQVTSITALSEMHLIGYKSVTIYRSTLYRL